MFSLALHRLGRASLFLAVSGFLAAMSPANAADFRFPASSFGKLFLTPNQTTGGHSALMAAQDGGAFEPISEFNIEDRYREFSAPIARLDMLIEDAAGDKFLSNCTANLIAPDVLLTNYHCIPGMNSAETVLKSIAVFDFLREDQDEAPTYSVDVTPIAADRDRDFALLRVQGEPGNRFGYFKLQPQLVKPNQSLFIIHHPAGMPKRLTRFRCKAYAPQPYSAAQFRHRCDTLGGSSGSLIFNLDFQVVALHNKGGLNQTSTTSFNSGISIFSLMEHDAFTAFLGGDPPPPAASNPPALPSGFSLYDKKPDDVAAAPASISHDPLPLRSNALCDAVSGGRICASSMLKPQGSGKYNYRMANLAKDDGTAWVENKKSHGIGEWLLFDFGSERQLSKIVFRNGYARSTKTFQSNSRIEEITLQLSNGQSYRIAMSDNPEKQAFTLPESQRVKWIKLTIDSVFKGSKYADTALSFIEFR